MNKYCLFLILIGLYQSYFVAQILYQNQIVTKNTNGLWYVYGTTDFDKKDCLTFNFTHNFFSNNLEINYQINQIPYYQCYSINPLTKNKYLINNKTLNIIHNNGETLYLTMNNQKYILLKKEHITCEYHMIFVKFMLVMHNDNINKYNLIEQKYC